MHPIPYHRPYRDEPELLHEVEVILDASASLLSHAVLDDTLDTDRVARHHDAGEGRPVHGRSRRMTDHEHHHRTRRRTVQGRRRRSGTISRGLQQGEAINAYCLPTCCRRNRPARSRRLFGSCTTSWSSSGSSKETAARTDRKRADVPIRTSARRRPGSVTRGSSRGSGSRDDRRRVSSWRSARTAAEYVAESIPLAYRPLG